MKRWLRVAGLGVLLTAWLEAPLAEVSTPPPPATTSWTVSGQQILLNGSSFFGNGIAYEPIPIGFSDGSTFVDVYHDEWRALYKRDIPILRAMGVNTIRTYGFFGYPPTDGTDPSLPSALSNTLKDNYTNCIDSSTGDPKKDQSACTKYWDKAPWNHAEFLGELWNGGTNPIYALIGIDNESIGLFFPKGTTAGGNGQPTTGSLGYLGYKNYQNFYKNLIAWIGRNYGTHPALLGFALFNEKNDGRWDVDAFWDLINGYADQIHGDANLSGKLVGLALQTSSGDVSQYMSESSVLNAKVDFWGVNLYPVGNYGDAYKTYVSAHPTRAKPVMVTEYGALSVTHDPAVAGWPGCGSACPTGVESKTNETAAATAIQTNYQLVNNSSYPFFNGFYYFGYADEWWKMKDPGHPNKNTDHLWIHDLGTTPVGKTIAPSGYWDEEWWGLFAAQRTGYNTGYQRNDYRGNRTAWISGAEYYKTPPDYLIPRPQITTLMDLYTGSTTKTLADLPTQIAFTMQNDSDVPVAALYGYEATPAQTYQATYRVDVGGNAAVAVPANTLSFAVYNNASTAWVPMCASVAIGGSNAGGTLHVSGTAGAYTCSFSAPKAGGCSDLISAYPVYCEAVPGQDYGPAITWGCTPGEGNGNVDCSVINAAPYTNCPGSQKFVWMASQYYAKQSPQSASDCSFGGVGQYVGD